MTSKFVKGLNGILNDNTTAYGLMYNDWDALTPCQKECTAHLATAIQLEEEAYMTRHPEILAMLEIFLCEVINTNRRKDILEQAGYNFTRPFEELDQEIRQILKSPPTGPYIQGEYASSGFDVTDVETELQNIILKHYPLEPYDLPGFVSSTSNTTSSSFLSILSSDTTVPTPEPTPIPEPTLSEIIYKMVSNCVDKATMAKLTDDLIKYDTAYVELMKVVEEAMEIPVIEIRKDIVDLLTLSYNIFEDILKERARIAAEIAWDRRMRKKLKRTLRRHKNFKGYETPPTPTSDLPSSHESYRIPPPRPCTCHPQWTYNRYPKDRFGIYLPLKYKYPHTSTTVTPPTSSTKLDNELEENNN
ncbi:unnamed protein product [Arctia plantaginis]|uniref:Uncharacterized protein n=1 Tax=Arctia plantaginis TaxID=874455 RepID=A0A8S0Z0S6_ARCPL|nr:unnamed protein product [Arctia plantaginis]